MPTFTGAQLFSGLIFSSVGFVAMVYGKKMHAWKPMFIGLILMAYTYFVESTALLVGIGLALIGALFVFRE